jgi:hypothetical protein
MCNFLTETLKPDIFWTALSSIGTLLAVLVALFIPSYNELKRVNRVVRLIEGEITRNYEKAIKADAHHDVQFPGGNKVQIVLKPEDTARLLKLDLWNEYKYKLADHRPEAFVKYQDICRHIESLSDLKQVNEDLRSVKFKGEIEPFIQKCREKMGFD